MGKNKGVLVFGTGKIEKQGVREGVRQGVRNGFRCFDTASVYGNEEGVGDALQELMLEQVVRRDEIFIIGKIFMSQYRNVVGACEESLKKLKVEFVDLMLLHWPVAVKPDFLDISEICDRIDRFPLFKLISLWLFKVWQQMESLVEKGLAKSIGVSNWTVSLLIDLLAYCKIPPLVNQIEVNPYNNRQHLISFCQKNNILIQAYRVIFSPPENWQGFNKCILQHPLISELSCKYNKTPAQICIQWALSQGCSVIVKSIREEKMRENYSAQFFEIEEKDLDRIGQIEQEGHYTDLYFSFGIHIFK